MSAGDNIGMMEGAFFVSKGVILEWLNELLDVSHIKSVLSYLKMFWLVTINEDRVMRNSCCVLLSDGFNLPGNIQFPKSEVGSKVWLRIHWKLQSSPTSFRKEWCEETYWCKCLLFIRLLVLIERIIKCCCYCFRSIN